MYSVGSYGFGERSYVCARFCLSVCSVGELSRTYLAATHDKDLAAFLKVEESYWCKNSAVQKNKLFLALFQTHVRVAFDICATCEVLCRAADSFPQLARIFEQGGGSLEAQVFDPQKVV